MRVARRGLVAAVLAVSLSGCASFMTQVGDIFPSSSSTNQPSQNETVHNETVQNETVLEVTSGSNPDATPFALEVIEEINDGSRLTVRGRFTPKVAWDPKQILVRLSALDDNGEQRLSYFPVADSMVEPKAEMLEGGKATEFTVSIPSDGLSNYQIELLWGADAAPFLEKGKDASPQQFLALRNLEVHRVPDESCATPDECVVRFTITGQFFNSGSATVSQIMLSAGFLPADNLDLQGQILENERRIEVKNLRLGPGEIKPFRLTLEKEVPSSTQMAPRPVVKIDSFESSAL